MKTCKTLSIVVDVMMMVIISQELWLYFHLKNYFATTSSQIKNLKVLLIIVNDSVSTNADAFTWNYLLSVKQVSNEATIFKKIVDNVNVIVDNL